MRVGAVVGAVDVVVAAIGSCEAVSAVGAGVGSEVVGSEVVGSEVVGSEVLGAEVGDGVGSDVVGSDVVGSEVVGSDVVGSEVVGVELGAGVGATVNCGAPHWPHFTGQLVRTSGMTVHCSSVAV